MANIKKEQSTTYIVELDEPEMQALTVLMDHIMYKDGTHPLIDLQDYADLELPDRDDPILRFWPYQTTFSESPEFLEYVAIEFVDTSEKGSYETT